VATDDRLPSDSSGQGHGRDQSRTRPELPDPPDPPSFPTMLGLIASAIQDTARTVRLIVVLIAVAGVVAALALLVTYSSHFFESHSDAAAAVSLSTVSATLGAAVGLAGALYRKRADVQELRELERAAQSPPDASGPVPAEPDAESGDNGVAS
jgi:hypothetical protein